MKKKSKLLKIPIFKNRDEEFEFWSNDKSSGYLDFSTFKRGVEYPNLRLTTKSINIRFPEYMITSLKNRAAKIDIPYQSLIKTIIAKELTINP